MLSKYLLSYKETAHLLGVTPRHVQRLVKAGVIPSITLGRRRLFNIDTLREVIRQRERFHSPPEEKSESTASPT